jgi:predicted amidohydrolase
MRRTGLLVLFIIFLVFGALSAGTPPSSSIEEPDDRQLRVAVCQTFCIDGDIEGNLKRIEYAIEDASRRGAQLACFPETALIGWVNPAAHELAAPIPGALSNRISALAKKHDIMISIGLCEKDGESLHDSAILVGRDGQILLKHRKINILTELMHPPYAPGSLDEIRAVDTPIGRVGMLICADTFKDEIIDAAAARKPELLIVPYGWAADTNEWPDHGKQLAAWVAHTARRAGCPVIGTDLVGSISTGPWKGKTYGGQSVVADATGRILATLRDRDAEVRVIDLMVASP